MQSSVTFDDGWKICFNSGAEVLRSSLWLLCWNEEWRGCTPCLSAFNVCIGSTWRVVAVKGIILWLEIYSQQIEIHQGISERKEKSSSQGKSRETEELRVSVSGRGDMNLTLWGGSDANTCSHKALVPGASSVFISPGTTSLRVLLPYYLVSKQ